MKESWQACRWSLISEGALFACGRGGDAPATKATAAASASETASSVEVPPAVARLTGLTTAIAQKPSRPRVLQLRGSLALDVNRLVHVHARIAGQIVHLETIEEESANLSTAPKARRTLNFMDHV